MVPAALVQTDGNIAVRHKIMRPDLVAVTGAVRVSLLTERTTSSTYDK